MLKVDLYSSKRRGKKHLGYANIVFLVLLAGFMAYFLYEFGSVFIGILQKNSRLSEIKAESETISAQILKENEKLNRYVVAKFVMSELVRIRKGQYKYKANLDKIVSLLPTGTQLDEISFTDKSAIEVKATSSNDLTYRYFEENLNDKQKINELGFDGVFLVESTRTDKGSYQSRLIFSVKPSVKQ